MADGQMELMINRAVLDPSATSGPNCDNSTDNHLVTMHHVLMLHDSGDDRGAILAAAIRPVAALSDDKLTPGTTTLRQLAMTSAFQLLARVVQQVGCRV